MPRFLTLPSDSSTQFWPENTSARFRVHLPKPIDFDLNESYEVALCQFQYSHAYVNLPQRVSYFEIRRVSDARMARIRPPMVGAASVNSIDMDTTTTPEETESITYYYGTVKHGHYKSATDLTKGINEAITKALRTEYALPLSGRLNWNLEKAVPYIRLNENDDCSAFVRSEFFVYDEITNRITCDADNLGLIRRYTDMPDATIDRYSFIFHPEMCLRLGYTSNIPVDYQLGDHERGRGFYKAGDYYDDFGQAIEIKAGAVGESTVDHNLGFHNIYIYSDIVKESNTVGDTLQPCLRVIPIAEEKRNEMVLVEPTHMHFFPLRNNYIRDVEIVLRTDTGAIAPFERGSSVVTLAIRRSSPLDIIDK